jgi:hypothetical protein
MAYLSGSAQPQNVVRVTLLIPGREFRGTFTSTIALASYAGFYRSAELDTTYKPSVEQGNLTLRMTWNPAIKPPPLVPNEFSGADMTLVFHKDSNNRVSDLTVFAGWNGWISNERFEKVN